ncbi:MAG: hypothetical protein FGM20_05940 [Burkholderiaceae bacterium]|jgi:hypothetical protein|nr:hypothetical protein [Burkholderiaceae bacterium]
MLSRLSFFVDGRNDMRRALDNSRAPKTYRDYIFAINKYLIPFFGKMAVASIRDETIEDFSAAAAEIGVCVTASPGRS